MPGFEKGAERELHHGRIIRLAIGEFTDPDGRRFERELVHHPGAVSVVPVHDDGRVTLVRQYRAALGADLLEIPAGLRDVAGEAPETTANRELGEEVGLAAGRLEHLCAFHNSAGFSDEVCHIYLGTELRSVATDHHSVEERHATVEVVALDDAPSLISTGAITDAKTIIGLLLAASRR